jgi:RNA polymerase sigma-70 factor (ECF subfamily)
VKRVAPSACATIDASDILQEAYVDAARRAAEYAANPNVPLFLWFRLLTGQRLLIVHRQHLNVKMRDVGHEVSLYRGALPQASSVSLAAQLLGRLTSPSLAAMRAEMQLRLQEALNNMDALDREVLTLRHFEELSNGETARVLGIQKSAASNRYVRALGRLRKVLSGMPGFFSSGTPRWGRYPVGFAEERRPLFSVALPQGGLQPSRCSVWPKLGGHCKERRRRARRADEVLASASGSVRLIGIEVARCHRVPSRSARRYRESLPQSNRETIRPRDNQTSSSFPKVET